MYCRDAIELLATVRDELEQPFSLSKAGLFSWLIFFCRAPIVTSSIRSSVWGQFFSEFESRRSLHGLGEIDHGEHGSVRADLYGVYNDRVKSRVADVSSVILRDLSLWGVFVLKHELHEDDFASPLRRLKAYLQENSISGTRTTERTLQDFVAESDAQWEHIR
jgi:hypothetical protein